MNVEQLIVKSLQELKQIACEKDTSVKQSSKLIFPKYCVGIHSKHEDTQQRISEQEIRFLFARELENQENKHPFFYSIEIPTKESYKFSLSKKDNKSKNKPKDYFPRILDVDAGGRSASIDLTLYEKEDGKGFCRKHLIEFKQGNVDTCKKDFLKLLYDMDELENYYINVLYREDWSNGEPLSSLIGKYQSAINKLITDDNNKDRKKNSKLKIILFKTVLRAVI